MRTATVITVLDAPQGPGMPDDVFESQHESLRREFRNIERAFGHEPAA